MYSSQVLCSPPTRFRVRQGHKILHSYFTTQYYTNLYTVPHCSGCGAALCVGHVARKTQPLSTRSARLCRVLQVRLCARGVNVAGMHPTSSKPPWRVSVLLARLSRAQVTLLSGQLANSQNEIGVLPAAMLRVWWAEGGVEATAGPFIPRAKSDPCTVEDLRGRGSAATVRIPTGRQTSGV